METNNGIDHELHSGCPRDPTISAYNISWTNLSYVVDDSYGYDKEILFGLNGIAYPGFVVAILGASGAGKTSLLDVLAGRVDPTRVTGVIQINGATEVPVKHVSRYCLQQEALFGNLTVYETLMYAADFNLPKSTPRADKLELVKTLLQEFGLVHVKDTIIGSPLRRGCSGGEVKRVSVASQVIGLKTGILFLDEPTSGLDSVAAEAVISSLCTLAKKYNITVLTTIHQPSTATFDLFTHFLLLAKGRTVYYGDREEAIQYFESIDYPIPVHSNPADVYLQLTSVDFDSDPKEGQQRISNLIESFAKSDEHKCILAEILENHNFPPHGRNVKTVLQGNGFWHQTLILMSRSFVNAFKNPLAYWVRVAMYFASAILMGTTWFRMDTNQTTVNDRLSCLVFSVAFSSFMAVAAIPAFLEERLVFMREKANGLYGVGSYVISNLMVSVPFIFIITMTFSGVAYFSMGLQETTEKFCTFCSLLFMSLMIAEAQTVLISVAVPIFVGALAVCAFTNGLWMIVEGYFVQKKNIPSFWRYTFHQIDFQKYVYEILITNEMEGLTFSCKDSKTDACACIIPKKNSTAGKTCSFTGNDVLKFYDYADIDYTAWLVILLAIFIVLKIVTWLILNIQTTNDFHRVKKVEKQNGHVPKNFQSVKMQDILKHQKPGIGTENKGFDAVDLGDSEDENKIEKTQNLV